MIYKPVTTASPQISVVVPTLPNHSVESLEELKNQQDVDYEVIIVKDGSLDICEARNEGIRRANSELIALTDDDTAPPRNWLATAVKVFEQCDVVLLEGPVGEEKHIKRMYFGCNIAFTKAAWRGVGGFDSRFAGWMDDIVFGWEIEKTFGQETTKFHPDFKMVHPPPMRSEPDKTKERLVRQEYPERYFEIFWNPDSLFRKSIVYAASQTYHIAPSLWEHIFYIGSIITKRQA